MRSFSQNAREKENSESVENVNAAAAELPFERDNPPSSCLQFIASAMKCGIMTILTYSVQQLPPKALKLVTNKRKSQAKKNVKEVAIAYISTSASLFRRVAARLQVDLFPMYFVPSLRHHAPI